MPAKARRRDEVSAIGAQLAAAAALLSNPQYSEAALADVQRDMTSVVETVAARCSAVRAQLDSARGERLRVVAEAENRASRRTRAADGQKRDAAMDVDVNKSNTNNDLDHNQGEADLTAGTGRALDSKQDTGLQLTEVSSRNPDVKRDDTGQSESEAPQGSSFEVKSESESGDGIHTSHSKELGQNPTLAGATVGTKGNGTGSHDDDEDDDDNDNDDDDEEDDDDEDDDTGTAVAAPGADSAAVQAETLTLPGAGTDSDSGADMEETDVKSEAVAGQGLAETRTEASPAARSSSTNDGLNDTESSSKESASATPSAETSANINGETPETASLTTSSASAGAVNHKRKNTGSKTTAPSAAHGRFVPNPRSEFVEAQAQPLSALKLFGSKPEDQDRCALLGVTSYPSSDLLDMLPGPVPDEDYTRAKPPNQVQFTTFAASLEPYFRPFTEEDLAFLQQKLVGAEVVSYGRTISPYMIPPLGPAYTIQWREEDGPNPGYTLPQHHTGNSNTNSTSSNSASGSSQVNGLANGASAGADLLAQKKIFEPLGSPSDVADQNLEANRVALGPLSKRLLAALMPEDEDDVMSDGQDSDSDGELARGAPQLTAAAASQIPPGAPDARRPFFASFASLEDRLRREFMYVGILDLNIVRADERKRRDFKVASASTNLSPNTNAGETEIDWVNMAEDDEICAELRELQAKLKRVATANMKRRRRLLPVVEELMAYQEYQSILDDLDRQVDQAYLKRLRVPKSKKKKVAAAAVVAAAASESAVPSPSAMSGAGTPSAAPAAANSASALIPGPKSSLRYLLDKRARWISKIGSLFLPQHEMLRSHETFKFAGSYDSQDDEDDDDENEEEDELDHNGEATAL